MIAALIASSASTEQWIFTGGSARCSAIWVFLIVSASSRLLPLTHSVTSELDVLNDAVLGNLDLQLHHVAARRRTDQAGADPVVRLVESADVTRVLVVVDYFLAV
jgi:hypothetical protein